MSSYDIATAFEKIENELIDSMMRNFERHKAEESKEGFKWDMWQAKQLEALAEYKKYNKETYPNMFNNINKNIEKAIRKSYKRGGLDEEIKILKAIERGFTDYSKSDTNFFMINNRKLNALVQATTHDIKKAEYATLRMSEDKYRQTIFDAQVYANSGVGTYEKAVDMAVRDMLYAGLSCVEYKNGARHTLSNYSGMAIRTATKRAYLQGEGDKRKEWGISTVILNKRSNACPLCLPFVGKVLIDDVWSGGKQEDGEYMLMSKAIEHGLYHPNCKDSHTTYFKELDDEPEVKYSKKELEEILEKDKALSTVNDYNNKIAKYERLGKYSLDKDNKDKYFSKSGMLKMNLQLFAAKNHEILGFNKGYADITDEWCSNASGKKGEVIKRYDITVGRITYKVDNHHVKLDFSEEEYKIAELVSNKYGKVVELLPKVNYPLGVRTSDYIIDGEYFDLKTIREGAGKNTIYNRANKSKGQTANLILDISSSGLSDCVTEEQIEKIYKINATKFINKIVLIKNSNIYRVYTKK